MKPEFEVTNGIFPNQLQLHSAISLPKYLVGKLEEIDGIVWASLDDRYRITIQVGDLFKMQKSLITEKVLVLMYATFHEQHYTKEQIQGWKWRPLGGGE